MWQKVVVIYQKQYLIDFAFYYFLFEIMSKPESVKIDPWTDFPKQPYTFITDDFCHDKVCTLKVNSKGEKSTVNLKANINRNDKAELSISDEVKFWFQVAGSRSIYSKIKSNNYLKLHYDNGIIEQWNSKWNLYASLNSSKSLENISVRLGAANSAGKCHSDTRLRVDFNADNKRNLTLYNRTVVTHDKFTFGLLAAYGITHNVLVKNNLLFGFKVNETTNASLRVQNNGYRKDHFDWSNWKGYFDNVKVDAVSKFQSINNIQYGLEGVFSLNGKSLFEEALLVVKHHEATKNLTTKLRLSSNANVSLAFKYPSLLFTNIGSVTIGAHGSNLLNDRRAFKFGLQLQINA